MTVKELKDFIKDLPDDMKVGKSGHYGEYLECWDVVCSTVDVAYPQHTTEMILNIYIEDAGPEPD